MARANLVKLSRWVVQMPPPPLLGYNNNVRHRGRIFHIQTEDSGVTNPRIMTHLFADGGRIVKSTRTDYSEHLGREDLVDVVRKLMKEQHKAMFVALRGGSLDALIGFESEAPPAVTPASAQSPAPRASTSSVPAEAQASDQQASDQQVSEVRSRSSRPSFPERDSSTGVDSEGRNYAAPRPAAIFADAPPRESLFGERVMEKSLDETILSYLSEDAEAADGSR